MVRHGMMAYLHTFGHDEAETLAMIKAVLAKLAIAEQEPDAPTVGR